jgi:hypothetical protein
MNKLKRINLFVALTLLLVLTSVLQINITSGASALDHFVFDTIGSPQTEGIAFWIIITAKDANGETVTEYTGTNTLAVSVGTISPSSTTTFSNGSWSDWVTLDTRGDNVRIFTTGGPTGDEKDGTSNPFNVVKGEPKVVDHFEFDYIGSPQTAGVSFWISITAKDVDGETVPSYSGTNTLHSSVGTITPSNIDFSNGNWMERVTVSQDSPNVIIFTEGVGKSGSSNAFRVEANRGFLNVLVIMGAVIAGVVVVAVIGYKKVLKRPKKPPPLARYPRSST